MFIRLTVATKISSVSHMTKAKNMSINFTWDTLATLPKSSEIWCYTII